MKNTILFIAIVFLMSSCGKECQECGIYFLDGDSSNDIIRLNNDGSFDFKDRGSSYILGGTWKSNKNSLTMVCDKSFENGVTFNATLSNDSLYLDEQNVFIRTLEQEKEFGPKEEDEISMNEQNTEEANVAQAETNNCFFVSKDYQDEEYSEVFISINGVEHKLENVSGMGMSTVEKTNFSDYSIPSNAIHGMENFWAGLQTVFYVVQTNGSIVIMRGYLDEGGDDISFEEIAKF